MLLFCGVVTDASSNQQSSNNNFPSVDSIFKMGKWWTAKMLNVQNKATVRAKTSAQYVHRPLENNGCVSKNIAFSEITVIQFLKG